MLGFSLRGTLNWSYCWESTVRSKIVEYLGGIPVLNNFIQQFSVWERTWGWFSGASVVLLPFSTCASPVMTASSGLRSVTDQNL